VLYFLHGLGDNEQTLFNSGGWTLLDDLRNQHKMGDFLIVAPEGGRSFYINSADGSERYGDFVMPKFVPRLRSCRGRTGTQGRISEFDGRYAPWFVVIRNSSAVSAQSAALVTETPQLLDAASNWVSSAGCQPILGKPIDARHWAAILRACGKKPWAGGRSRFTLTWPARQLSV
jgi:hypothetical protein